MKPGYICLILAFLSILSACSSDETSCHLDGNFEYQTTISKRGCPLGLVMETAAGSMQVQTDGDNILLLFPGIQGGCPGVVKSCETTLACNFLDAAGNRRAEAQLSITFDNNGFTGTMATALFPPAVQATCTDEFTIKGTRK